MLSEQESILVDANKGSMNARIIPSYHNHTLWSDGSSSISAMVEGARRAGVTEIGISDHYVLTPSAAPLCWSMPLDALDAYVAEVKQVMRDSNDITVLLGIEADYFPATINALRAQLDRFPFDYRIGSVHLLDDFPLDEDPCYWESLCEEERIAMCRRYWQQVRAMAASDCFDIAGHLDLYKKFGYRPSMDLGKEIEETIDAIAAAGLAIELNTAGWSKPVNEAYPDAHMLRLAKTRGIPLCINADAHRPDDVAAHFDRARALAHACGYRELCLFRQRERRMIPLEK